MSHKFHTTTVCFLMLLVVALVTANKPATESDATDPAAAVIDYRPGAYFPSGFQLHGQVKLLSNPVAEAGRRSRIQIEYTVGDVAVETGMAVEIWRHFTSDVEEFQTADPDKPAWFGARLTAPGVTGKTTMFTNWMAGGARGVWPFPYRKCAGVAIEQGRLKQGDKVLFDLGGTQGVRMQYYQENLFNFRIAITKNGVVTAYGGDANLTVTGGEVQKLKVQAPSIVQPGETFSVEVVPQDAWGSLARNHRGLSLQVESGNIGAADFQYDPELMHYVARNVTYMGEDVLRIGVRTADGRARGVSNPIWPIRDPTRRVYFGDLHQHGYIDDGRGKFLELYLFARRVALLDFGAVTPHHMNINIQGPRLGLEGKNYPRDTWPEIMSSTRLMNGWKGFVSILGYEYSVPTNLGGHHNIFYNAGEAKTVMQLDPEDPNGPIGKMLKTLQGAKVPALVIPHIGGGAPDWTHPTDPRVERLFEIASVHGVFEESYQKHLEAGVRLGASASGDTHTTSMGEAYPGLTYVMSNGLTAVYAQSKSRDGIWNALCDRRTFAVTNATRILLDFHVNGEPMGGELPLALSKDANVTVRVSGTAPIVRIDLLKNSRVIHSVFPARGRRRLLRVMWGDNIYQRRASEGRRGGEMIAEGGTLRLHRPVNLDQGFEQVEQNGAKIAWTTSAVSNDRDGFLADLSGVNRGSLVFRQNDTGMMGAIEVRVPLEQLMRDGAFSWSKAGGAEVKNPYMAKMGVPPTFFLDCELVDPEGLMDVDVSFQDRSPLKTGDYYYIRMEQLDGNRAWSSPVWIN